MTTNLQLSKKLDEIIDELGEFQEKYHDDMHGDSKINGDRGIVGNLRELKEFPSIPWLLSHRTKETVGAIVLVLAIWQALWTLGIAAVFTQFFGIELPF